VAKFLDQKTIQSASYANSILIPICLNQTNLSVGELSINTQNASGTIRISFSGTVSVLYPFLSENGEIILSVSRGTTTTPAQGIVYSVSQILEANVYASKAITFTGADYNVPLPPAGEAVVYTLFIRSSILGVMRTGPESFNVMVVSN